MDEQSSKPSNEIVKLVLNSKRSLTSSTNPLELEILMPVDVQKVYFYEAETQTTKESENDSISDQLSREAGDEARLTGSNKYGLLSLDEYQIIRTGEEHCLKKYFSDDDRSIDDSADEENRTEIEVDQQLQTLTLNDRFHRNSLENVNNNASILLRRSHSNLSNTFYLDENTHLSATLAQSTSSRISHSRYLPVRSNNLDDDEDDDELDQLVASTFTPKMPLNDRTTQQEQTTVNIHQSDQSKFSSIRNFLRQTIHSCQENLTLADQLLEQLPISSYEHVRQRKVRRINCIMNIPKSIKGIEYNPSVSVQTDH